MNFKLILEIALSLMRARFKQTVIAAVGVTFGVTMFVTLLSFMNGLNQMLDGLILNRTAHVRLYNEVKPTQEQPVLISEKFKNNYNIIHSIKPKDSGKEIRNSKAIIKALKADKRVIDVAPKVMTPVFFNTGNIEIAGIINGVDVPAEDRLFLLSDYVIEGSVSDLATESNSIIIGKGLADKILASVGDVVQITTSKGELTSLKVVGIAQFGLAEIDNTMTYTSLGTAQKLIQQPASYITDIQVKLKDILLAPAAAIEYSKNFDVDARDIQTENSQFETGSKVRNIISYAVGITLLIVAGFGIYNILNMLIYEKMDTIAILKATGFSGNDVKMVFVSLALIIGITGGVFGLLFGYILSSIIDAIPFVTPSLPTIKTYPIYYNPVYYFIGITFAVFTTFIAGLFPAQKASKVDPVVIIRGK